jgi:hypothetical protein
MSLFSAQLAEVANSDWHDVFGMPVPQRQDILLDVVFVTQQCSIRLLGSAFAATPKEEVFSLTTFPFDPNNWWRPNNPAMTPWKPKNIRKEMESRGYSCLLSDTRQIRYYISHELRSYAVSTGRESILCSAVEFSKSDDGRLRRLTVSASVSHPCAVDYDLTEDLHSQLLSNMVELPESWGK